MPRRSGFPGWMRWSPEDGEGGLRRVLLPRPLVRRKATIKSTGAMRYFSLKKAQTNDISQTQFPYKITNDSSKTPIPYKKGFHPKGQNPFLILQVFEKLTP